VGNKNGMLKAKLTAIHNPQTACKNCGKRLVLLNCAKELDDGDGTWRRWESNPPRIFKTRAVPLRCNKTRVTLTTLKAEKSNAKNSYLFN
jgi:hypothetical protein